MGNEISADRAGDELNEVDMNSKPFLPWIFGVLIAAVCLAVPDARGQELSIPGPTGSGRFGEKVYSLPNGNFVVVDQQYSAPGPINQVGAVYLYDSDANLISILTGSSPNDRVGDDGVKLLGNGHFVVRSRFWNNGAVQSAGAYTWVNGTTGLNGVVSAENSLVGSATGDFLSSEVVALGSGDYVIRAPGWDADGLLDVGAVIWADGNSGVAGPVSEAGALRGGSASDRVGSSPIVELANGSYLVISPNWNHGAATRAGAVTWIAAGGGLNEVVSAQNSLVGSSTNDFVGNSGITELANGHFVVASGNWDNGSAVNAGAVTWGNGHSGITGVVSAANSLVGSSLGDQVGVQRILALSNGHYVVPSGSWDSGGIADVGAVTWGNGETGISGVVSAENSLVGSTATDRIGQRLYAVGNGNYVVGSPFWHNGTVQSAGAVTWADGTSGITGPVSVDNSLVGTQPVDNVGADIDVLANGHYVVRSTNWDNGSVMNAGAVTWGDGNAGIIGAVAAANSLVGSSENDRVGNWAVTVLTNGNYVVPVPDWRNGAISRAGAATWGNGTIGITGPVSSANSLVGSQTDDGVVLRITVLSNGHYVVSNRGWDHGGIQNVGAVTWGNGQTGISGPVSPENSLVGSTAGDGVGDVGALANGNYVVISTSWDNGAIPDVGAVTWANGASGLVGVVDTANSLVGSSSGDFGSSTSFNALASGDYVVGNPSWSNGALTAAGAVTWGSGSSAISGVISAANSLVGSRADDKVGLGGFTALPDGNYVVASHEWNNGAILRAGARTLARADGSTVGAVGPANSILGTSAERGFSLTLDYDPMRAQLIVGRPFDNIVSLLRFSNDALFRDRFELDQ